MASTPYNLTTVGRSAVKNLLLNGDFTLWQRGTGSTSVASSSTAPTYLSDRFGGLRDTANAPTVIQSSDVPTFAQSGYQSRFSLLFTNNASGVTPSTTQRMAITTRVEGQDYQAIHGHRMRLQFWVKSSVNGTFTLALQNSNAVSNSANARSYITTYIITNANTWEFKSIDVTLDTNTNYNFDNTIGLAICWTLGAGSTVQAAPSTSWQAGQFFGATGATNWAGTNSATFQLAQVMLVPGNYESGVSIPHSRAHKLMQNEIQSCKRYYTKSYDINTAPGTGGSVAPIGSRIVGTGVTTQVFGSRFNVDMRTTPSVVIYSGQVGTINKIGSDGGSDAAGTAAAQAVSSVGFQLVSGLTGLTDTGSYSYQYTADAEL